jgi:hypothetical protein
MSGDFSFPGLLIGPQPNLTGKPPVDYSFNYIQN